MQQVIHGPNTSYHIATLANLARAYQEFGQLQKAVVRSTERAEEEEEGL